MKPDELFLAVRYAQYTTSGDCVDWRVEVDEGEKKIRLMFQCSRELANANGRRDWINNLRVLPAWLVSADGETLVAAGGYVRAYCSVRTLVLDALEAAGFLHGGYAVEVAGWSYGGVLALLAAWDVCKCYGVKPCVVTFGAPCALYGAKSRAAVERSCKSIRQYAHANDLLAKWVFGCKAAGRVRLGGKAELRELLTPAKWHCIYGKAELYGGL